MKKTLLYFGVIAVVSIVFDTFAETAAIEFTRRAASYDEKSGVESFTERTAEDDYDKFLSQVKSCDGGDWFSFKGFHFAEGIYDSLAVYYAKKGENGAGGSIEIRLDSPTGTLIGTISLTVVHQFFDHVFRRALVTLSEITGDHTVYFVFQGGDNLCRVGKIVFYGSLSYTAEDAKTYYIAKYGKDTNDGLSLDTPFLTIQKAAAIMKPGSVCKIRGGTYRETVSPVYSGTAAAPLTFEAFGGEDVVISGAELVTGWAVHEGKIYRAPMDWDLSIGCNQLYVDGEAMFEARTPNADLAIGNWDDEYAKKNNGGTGEDMFSTVMTYCAIGQNVSSGDMTGASTGGGRGLNPQAFDKPDGFFNGAMFWSHGAWRPALGEIRQSRRSSDGGQDFDIYAWCWMGNFTFGYVAGILNCLDNHKEWVLQDGNAYVWTPDGDDPSKHIVEAKKRILAFDLTGKSYVNVRNLRIFASSITLRDADNCVMEGLNARYISHYTIWSPNLAWAGSDESSGFMGIYVSGNNNIFRNCTIAHSANSGICLAAGSGHKVQNCYIHHCNYTSTYGAPVDVVTAESTIVEYCDLHTAGRSCINNGTWKARYNKLHNSMLISSEGGSIYYYGPGDFVWKGEEFSYNWFWDSKGALSAAVVSDGGGRANWLIHHNVIWHGASEARNPCNLCIDLGWNIAYNNTYFDSVGMWGNWEVENPGHNELYLWRGGNAYWKLSDTANFEFWPTEGSPAIDAGSVNIAAATGGGTETLPAQTIDASAYTGSAPDLGAYEHNGKRWVPGPVDYAEPEWTYPPDDIMSSATKTLSAIENRSPISMKYLNRHLRVSTPRGAQCTVAMYNALGSRLIQTVNERGGAQTINLSGMSSGYYLVRFTVAGRMISRRLFIHR